MSLIQRFSIIEKYTRYSFLIIILFSIIVLTLVSIYHVSGDGCWHASVSKFIAKNGRLPLFEPLGRDEPFWSPPLHHIITAIDYSLLNLISGRFADFAVKFVSPIFSILALFFSFLTMRKIFNSKIAFYSILFLAFIPIYLDYSIFSYVEATLTLFVILSIYFLLNGKIFLSGIAAGLSILAKYNGAFVLPVLVFIAYKKYKKKQFYKNSAIIIALSLLIASPWLIRNWALLGNPVWPFLNFIFSGYQAKSYSNLNLNTIIDPELYKFTYFGIFGVPDGNYKTLSLVNIPYFKLIFFIWLIGTFIFTIPLILGILNVKNFRKSFKNYDIIAAMILSYLFVFFMYAVNVGLSVSRMLLPAFPALAAVWALGYDKLTNKLKFKNAIFLIAILIISGFALTEFVKLKFASNSWDFYEKDFEWVRLITSQNAIFIAEGQCIPYNIKRTSVYFSEENLKKTDYIWVNQNFNLDRRSVLTNEKLNLINSKNYRIVYENNITGTIIYDVR